MDGDKENGCKMLVIFVGCEWVVGVFVLMFIVFYIWIIVLIIVGIVLLWMFIVFLSVLKVFKVTKGFIGKSILMEMVFVMIVIVKINIIFGFLMGIGLLFGYFL